MQKAALVTFYDNFLHTSLPNPVIPNMSSLETIFEF